MAKRVPKQSCSNAVPWLFLTQVTCQMGQEVSQQLMLFMSLQVLYRYGDGMYGLYPKTIGSDAPLTFQAGVLLDDGVFWRYVAEYHEDRSIDTIQWQRYTCSRL